MTKTLTMIEQAEQIEANGTSYHGHTIKAKLNELKELFGYDWKKGNFAEDQEIEWHIGGFNALGTHKAKNLIEFEIINLFAEEFLNNAE